VQTVGEKTDRTGLVRLKGELRLPSSITSPAALKGYGIEMYDTRAGEEEEEKTGDRS